PRPRSPRSSPTSSVRCRSGSGPSRASCNPSRSGGFPCPNARKNFHSASWNEERPVTDAFAVLAGGPLSGRVRVSGATKNLGLKQMAAALLAPGVTTLRNMDRVTDLDVMIDVMRAVGADVDWTGERDLTIDTSGPLSPETPYELVTRLRASVNVLGPLLSRCGEARVAMPGGDNIGSRPIDMHLRGLEAMGTELKVAHGFIEGRVNRLCGARIVLEWPSVGATENLLTAAVRAKGQTVIENEAREPEITELAAMLN